MNSMLTPCLAHNACWRDASLRAVRMSNDTDPHMKTRTAVCQYYEQLQRELTFAHQLCAEYDSPFVCPIDVQEISPERWEYLREAAEENRIHAEARAFLHQATCLLCLLAP